MRYSVVPGDSQADQEQLLRLWTNHFFRNQTKARSRYQWMYADNPEGPPKIWLVKDAEGSVVGATAVAARRLRILGREVLAGQAVDLVVEPEHRTVLPALLLHRAILRELPNSDFDLLYGFPNERSEKVVLRAGYRRLGALRRWSRPLRVRDRLEPLLRWKPLTRASSLFVETGLRLTWHPALRGGVRDCYGAVLDEPPLGLNDLGHGSGLGCQALGCRSGKFLAWRFKGGPARHRFFQVTRTDSTLLGYIAFRIDDGSASVSDFFAIDVGAMTRVFLVFSEWIRTSGAKTISLSFMGSPLFQDSLQRSGFFRRDSEGSVVVYPGPSLSPEETETVMDKDGWFLTVADRDV